MAGIGFRRNWDIDNISPCLAAGDIVTLPMLFLSAIIVLNSPDITILLFSIMYILVTIVLVGMAVSKGAAEMRRIFVQSAPVLTVCILLDIIAGVTIEHQLEALVALPVLLVLIPPFLEDANALGGILTSRFASLLHMGILEPGKAPGKVAMENFAIIYIFALWVFTLLGISSYAVGLLLGLASPPLWEMVFLSLTAGLVTVSVLNIIAYYVACDILPQTTIPYP